eukprot:s13_g36.t1
MGFGGFWILPGYKWACATACHSASDAAFCASVVSQKAYSLARSGSLKLPGFPAFETMVADLKKNTSEVPVPAFEVCVPVPNGLAVKQNLVDYWNGIENFQLEVNDLVKKHNAKYNPHGIKRGAAEISQSEGDGNAVADGECKKIRIETTMKLAEHEPAIQDKLCLTCGTCRLVYDIKEDALWIAGSENKRRETFEVQAPLELFGFGSGDYVEGPEASDVQSDVTGRWISFKVLSYKDAIKDLENAGEISVKLSMHTLEKTEGSNDFCFKAQKKVCFVLDQPKESKKKKAGQSRPTASLLQRCELASSSDDKTSEEKGETEMKAPTKKTRKAKTDDEDAPPVLKKPAAKKQKKDEYDDLFNDLENNDKDDNDNDDQEGDAEEEEPKKKKRERKKKEEKPTTKKSKSKDK